MWLPLIVLGLPGVPASATATATDAAAITHPTASAPADVPPETNKRLEATRPPRPDPPLARPGLPTAYVVGGIAAEGYYRFHGASLGGRSLAAHQAGAFVGLAEHVQIGADYVDILARGRTPGNYLEAQGWGLSVKHNLRPWTTRPDTAFSLELERRASSARAQVGGGEVLPPSATAYSVNVDFTTRPAERWTLHGRASAAYVTVGSELSATVLGGGVGADYRLLKVLALEANAIALQNSGSVRGTDVALSGGVVCGSRFGPFAAAMGTLWPIGVPMTGGPLADVAVFRMDPVVEGQPVGKQLANAALAILTLQAGFRAEW